MGKAGFKKEPFPEHYLGWIGAWSRAVPGSTSRPKATARLNEGIASLGAEGCGQEKTGQQAEEAQS
ncbi:MAG TPA: hypothetical protein VMZ27_07825 [Candidatus Saccharimonadales bacterium]|nr:hypothetical protein [Candidatus Saccharimonadales bacterium]